MSEEREKGGRFFSTSRDFLRRIVVAKTDFEDVSTDPDVGRGDHWVRDSVMCPV